MENLYSLDCSYFDKKFPSIGKLVDFAVASGMDPNYEITKNGRPTGEELVDYILF